MIYLNILFSINPPDGKLMVNYQSNSLGWVAPCYLIMHTPRIYQVRRAENLLQMQLPMVAYLHPGRDHGSIGIGKEHQAARVW